jgi:hypothetical protein
MATTRDFDQISSRQSWSDVSQVSRKVVSATKWSCTNFCRDVIVNNDNGDSAVKDNLISFI